MTTVNTENETDALLGEPVRLTLPASGVELELERLKTRQLLKLVKILTAGGGGAIADLPFDFDSDPEELTQQIIGILLATIPEAEEEVMEFIRSMVKPIGLVEPERSAADRSKNTELYVALYKVVDNPELEDTLELFAAIVKAELPNLKALGKKIATLVSSVAKPKTSSKKSSKPSTRTAS